MVLEKTLANPLDCKEMQPFQLKESNPDYSLERLMLILQYFGHLIRKAIGKHCDPGKDWNQKEMGAAEDEIVRYYHRLNVQIFEQTPGGRVIE